LIPFSDVGPNPAISANLLDASQMAAIALIKEDPGKDKKEWMLTPDIHNLTPATLHLTSARSISTTANPVDITKVELKNVVGAVAEKTWSLSKPVFGY